MSRSGEGGRARGRGGWAKDSFKIQDAVKTKMQFKGLESSLLPSPRVFRRGYEKGGNSCLLLLKSTSQKYS